MNPSKIASMYIQANASLTVIQAVQDLLELADHPVVFVISSIKPDPKIGATLNIPLVHMKEIFSQAGNIYTRYLDGGIFYGFDELHGVEEEFLLQDNGRRVYENGEPVIIRTEKWKAAAQHLNVNRDVIRMMRGPVIIWIPSNMARGYDGILIRMPDVFDWKEKVLSLG